MKFRVLLVALALVAGSAEAKPRGPAVAGVGDVIYHADIRAPLPNAFGKPDVFGRDVIVGRIDVRFLGLAADGRARFQRSEVPIVSNETTVTRGQGRPVVATAMSPMLFDMAVDLTSDPTIFVNGETIRVLSATDTRVTFEVVK
ncbi:MAG TPA: hypothetical protein VD906_02740 [Caulobacteraceae bacterium]|nr:hypothetical protein [Caulobacteraceae bacterium]